MCHYFGRQWITRWGSYMFSKFKVENEHLLFKLQKNSCLPGIQIAWDVKKKKMLWKYSAFMFFIGDQPWDFLGKNDAKAETPVLWPPHAKSWLIGKDSDAGRDWGQEEKGTTEEEMAGWHHWLDGRESEWTLGVGDGQGGLVCCSSWGHKESDTTEQLNWTDGFYVTSN